MVKDRLGTASVAAVSPAAFRVISRVQAEDPLVQITATAVALAAMAEAVGLDMRDVINVAERMMRDLDNPYYEHIRAIREYAKGELRE